MATTAYTPTASQQASARQLHSRRDEWVFATNKQTGQQFVRIPSNCKPGRGYYVSRSGDACTCEGSRRYPVCSHQLAVRLDLEERAEIERQHQAALPAWIEEVEEPAPKPAYETILPQCRNCSDIAEQRDGLCSRCASDREYAARLAAKRTTPRERTAV